MQKRWSICDLPQDSLQEVTLEHQPKRDQDEQSGDSQEVRQREDAGEVGDASRTDDPSRNCDQKLEAFPLRKCRSSFDLAMDSLRKEIVSTGFFFYAFVFI